MRISDWSSDVCSSDLGASVLLRARARQLWKSEILYASMLPQPAAMGNHTDGHTSRSKHDRARLRPGASLSQRRSEEHTSELQSLMRTSYAVFCLTKKQIIHKKKHTKTTIKQKQRQNDMHT